jgi:putative ATPase
VDLFEQAARDAAEASAPLADRLRPAELADLVGQDAAVGPGTPLRHAIESDRLYSIILWGPPGCGKTTLARLIAGQTRSHFVHFSAVLSGVKEIRSVIAEAREQRDLHRRRTVLFVDEIHRFNKSQQDAFLHHVESGLITLVGATTENPSFEVIAPLLSRCRVIPLEALSDDALGRIIDRALHDDRKGLGRTGLTLTDSARDHLIRSADGDARAALNGLEAVADLAGGRSDGAPVDLDLVEAVVQRRALRSDKAGESHFNLISAFHKSLRGSDPDAAIYWLTRMLMAGEDPLYMGRRMVRFASEDIGVADPAALRVALDGVAAYRMLGSPEGELALIEAAVYLATAPKSNAVYVAYKKARRTVERTGSLPVPHHIRNAPTGLMKSMGYGDGYRYAHDYEKGVCDQTHLPEALVGTRFYSPTDRGHERVIADRLRYWDRVRNETDDEV